MILPVASAQILVLTLVEGTMALVVYLLPGSIAGYIHDTACSFSSDISPNPGRGYNGPCGLSTARVNSWIHT